MNWGKLKIIRELLGLSQAEIAYKTGINQKDISLLEGGKKKFIPMEYIHFLYNENIDINSLYDDSLQIGYRNSVHTPTVANEIDVNLYDKTPSSVHPKKDNNVHPTVHPTTLLGLPKVITVSENDKELISLVPVKAAAGYLNGFGDPEYVETLPTIRMPNLGAGTHRAFEIKGHSMSPTMHNSSISIGRWVESLDEIRDGRIYIVVTQSEGIVVKRVLNRVNDSGKLILISDNHNKREYPNIILDASDVLELWYQRANLAFEFPEPDTINTRVHDIEARLSLFENKIKHLLK
jgi:DNA-binding XRE family transcriptional regulator